MNDNEIEKFRISALVFAATTLGVCYAAIRIAEILVGGGC